MHENPSASETVQNSSMRYASAFSMRRLSCSKIQHFERLNRSSKIGVCPFHADGVEDPRRWRMMKDATLWHAQNCTLCAICIWLPVIATEREARVFSIGARYPNKMTRLRIMLAHALHLEDPFFLKKCSGQPCAATSRVSHMALALVRRQERFALRSIASIRS